LQERLSTTTTTTALLHSGFHGGQRLRLRSLDEAFADLQSHFDRLAVDVHDAENVDKDQPDTHFQGTRDDVSNGKKKEPENRNDNDEEKFNISGQGHHQTSTSLSYPPSYSSTSSKVFPLLTKKQRDHFFQKYYKKKQKAEAMRITIDAPHTTTLLKGSEDLARRDEERRAAVLVLLCTVHGEPSIVFTRRSSQLSSHAGEISFPGGHHDPPLDRSMIDTALREAREELVPTCPEMLELCRNRGEKNSPLCLTLLGPATPVPSLKGIPVHPFVAAILGHDFPFGGIAEAFPGDPREVDRVFSVSVKELLRVETTHELPQNRFGMVRAPLFPAPTHIGGNIWGLTAFILRPLLHKLLAPVLVEHPSLRTAGDAAT
jgi:hypothetical protein